MAKKLIAKVFIKGRIVAETGLHIGGSKASLDIGGVDLNVIKTPHGAPFIPGSSLKGKLRSMLARTEGSIAVNKREAGQQELSDENFPYILQIFGSSGDADGDKSEVTRLVVRDAFLDTRHFNAKFKEKERAELDFDFSYVKWENTINRRTGTAQHPRQLERVPAGAEFEFELVYDEYNDASNNYENEDKTLLAKHQWAIETAMDLLRDDYLGGQGSRGYGQISFKNVTVVKRQIDQASGIYGAPIQAEDWQSIATKFQDNQL